MFFIPKHARAIIYVFITLNCLQYIFKGLGRTVAIGLGYFLLLAKLHAIHLVYVCCVLNISSVISRATRSMFSHDTPNKSAHQVTIQKTLKYEWNVIRDRVVMDITICLTCADMFLFMLYASISGMLRTVINTNQHIIIANLQLNVYQLNMDVEHTPAVK